MPAVDTDVVRGLASTLRDRAQELRDMVDSHVNEALSMEWHSTASGAFAIRTISDQAAVYEAATRVDATADALAAHADAVDTGMAERAYEGSLGEGPGRMAF